ncbi:MAG: site-specific DNA-methyltransferase [Kiritimatiellae bacterium]|nr:site-specific DNA-methyltransferase [Kiritimatiellia bacterium]
MIKDALKRNEAAATNVDALAVLRENFAGCFTKDGAFDLKVFACRIRDKVTVSEEGYQLDFLGKNYAQLLVNEETETVIVPDEAHNAKPENAKSQNVYISGDNLDALKHLLKSYEHEVKCIYIDPPYNTGSDGFVYNDNFKFKPDELARKLSITEEEAKKLLDFVGRGSASHSAWLMFMYPRLQLARSLLRDDGVIFISIDDNEQANLKLLCDSVFREENFLAMLARRTKSGGGSASDAFAVENDYVLVYARNAQAIADMTIPFDDKYLKRYKEQDAKGRFFWDTMERSSTQTTPYTITAPDGKPLYGKWFRSEETFKEDLKCGEVRFLKKKDGWSVQFKQRMATGKKLRSLISEDMQLDLLRKEFKSYSADLDVLGITGVFSYPKTVFLIKYLLQVVKGGGTIVDFFSGSGTTAEAVMLLNSERQEQDKLRYILVQLPEDLEETVKHAKGDSKAICENAIAFLKAVGRKPTLDQIGLERLVRAGEKIRQKAGLFNLDLGFKHFTLAKPSGEVLEKIESFDPKASVLATQDMLKEFGVETVLATWLNHDGYGLTREAEKVDLAGYEAYLCGHHLYLVNANFGAKNVKALLEKYETDKAFTPDKIVLFGYSFGWKELEELDTNLKKLKTTRNITADIDIRY